MFDGFLSLPVLAVGAFFAVSYFVNPATIIIEDISVPHHLSDLGVTHEVAAGMLTEKMAKIADAAGSSRGTLTTELTAQGRSVEALSDWFGLASPIRSTQVALGFLPYTFEGEIIEKGDDLVLAIKGKSPKYWHFSIEEHGPADDVEGLIQKVALRLMQEIDPYLVAVYHFREESAKREFPLTKEAIDFALVHADRRQLPWTYALLGDALRREGNYEQAIVKFRQAMILDPSFPRPMMRWGNALADQGRYDEAIGRYKKTLEIAPQYPEALIAWGEALTALGQHDEARRKYEEAVAMDPHFPRILFAYGKYLAANGDKAGGAEYLRQALHLEGGHNQTYVAALRKVQREVDPVLEEAVPLAKGMRSR